MKRRIKDTKSLYFIIINHKKEVTPIFKVPKPKYL